MTLNPTAPVLPVDALPTLTLVTGAHSDRTDGLCAMEVVAWLAGERHSDHPQCACPAIGAFMRSWNDAISDDDLRTKLLRPLLPALIGSRSTKAVELKRSYLALDWLVRVHAPAFLSLRDDLKAHAVALQGLAPLTDVATCEAARPALEAARAAAGDAARAAVEAAAGAAAGAAAWAAAWAAARAAAWAAAGDAAGAAAWAALAPTVAQLQASAADLVLQMVAVAE